MNAERGRPGGDEYGIHDDEYDADRAELEAEWRAEELAEANADGMYD